MREIKFRLWNKKEKKWIRDFAIYENGNILCWNDTQECRSIAPDSEDLIVSQFTNLKDRNGKEVFEFDIIRYIVKSPTNSRVYRYNTINLVFGEWYPRVGEFTDETSIDSIEVVGNAFENEDLLK